MSKNPIIIIILFVSFFASDALAQTEIKAEVDKLSIATEEHITYKLTITSSEKNIPSPQIPKFEGFKVLSQSQSSEISIAKGNRTTSIAYVFILYPMGIGKLKIGPSSIKIRGKTYLTDAFEIEVEQAEARPQPKPEKKPPLPAEDELESEQVIL